MLWEPGLNVWTSWICLFWRVFIIAIVGNCRIKKLKMSSKRIRRNSRHWGSANCTNHNFYIMLDSLHYLVLQGWLLSWEVVLGLIDNNNPGVSKSSGREIDCSVDFGTFRKQLSDIFQRHLRESERCYYIRRRTIEHRYTDHFICGLETGLGCWVLCEHKKVD